VGDASFQNKCLGKMEDVARGGRTVLFVSHNHQAVRRLCEYSIWLDHGRLKQIGPTKQVLDAYLHTVVANVNAEDVTPDPLSNDPNQPLRLLRLAVHNRDGRPTSLLYGEQSYTLEIEYEFSHPVKNVRMAALFRTAQDVDAFMTTDCDATLVRGLDRLPGRYVTRFEIPANFLTQGRYRITVWGAVTYVRQLRRREDALVVDVQYTQGWIMEETRNTAVNPLLAWHTERIN
jgi:lipopolysaccharide transport system ATP-binding protein